MQIQERNCAKSSQHLTGNPLKVSGSPFTYLTFESADSNFVSETNCLYVYDTVNDEAEFSPNYDLLARQYEHVSVCVLYVCSMRYEQCSKNPKYAVSSCDVPDTHPLVLIGIEIRQEHLKYMMIHIYEVSPFMQIGVSHGHHLNVSYS